MKSLVIFVSGTGTNMSAIIDSVKKKKINAKIKAVISSNHEAKAIKKANEENIDTFVFPLSEFNTKEERDNQILKVCKECNADYLVLAGYLGILSKIITDEYRDKIINIHPALLPKYGGKGFFGINVHKAVIQNKEKYSGATIHYVDSDIDTGKIIKQKKLRVKKSDTAESLQQRILKKIEPKLYISVLKKLCKGEREN